MTQLTEGQAAMRSLLDCLPRELVETLRTVVTQLAEEDAAMRRLLEGLPREASEVLRRIVTEVTEESALMRGSLHPLRAIGQEGRALNAMQQGMRQCMQQGMLIGRRESLREQLAGRFYEVPASVLERLEAADSVALQRWGQRVLTAPTLDDVFDPA